MSDKINFFVEKIKFKVLNKNKIRSWIKSTIKSEGCIAGELNFIFCDDKYLHRLNKKFLKHDTLTDIITFPLEEGQRRISGDIFISIDRIKDNAIKYNQRTDKEIKRVIIHGILHLIGYNDKSKKEVGVMRQKEDFYLSELIQK